MFIGHFGLAFAAKKINSKPSLGTTFLAAQFIDLLWPFFLLLGMEKVAIDPGNTAFTPLDFVSYPYSHSLLAVAIWALLFCGAYYLIKKDGKSAMLLALLVISHWLLDLVTHRPDLPLSFSEETKLGFGLWNYKTATIIIEVLLFSVGVWLYTTTTEAKNKKGIYALWGLVLFFVVIYFVNAFGEPPPDAKAIGYVGLAQWLFILWGYWVDRNRTARASI
jgi:membrane-bound metal-dependent hydrolase YbcI (DUF457 family)